MNARLTLKKRLRLAAVAAIMIPAAVTASPALAHDSLSSTSPAKDSVVATAPESVSLTLSEPPADSKNLNLSTITVTDGAREVRQRRHRHRIRPDAHNQGRPGNGRNLQRAVANRVI